MALEQSLIPKSSAGGRPSKLTQSSRDRLCAAARAGLKLKTCAHMAGISLKTLEVWRTKGYKGEPIYRDLLIAMEEARAEGEFVHAKNLRDAGKTDWRASEAALRLQYGYETKGRLSIKGDMKHDHVGGVLVVPAHMSIEQWIDSQDSYTTDIIAEIPEEERKALPAPKK